MKCSKIVSDRGRAAVAALVLAALSSAGHAAEVQLSAAADNTLYEDASGALSNGAGEYLFAGDTISNLERRLLVRFDVSAAIPPGATITDVTLRLHMSRTIAGAVDVALHPVSASWGEGASDANGPEGGGIAAEPGDATWLHRFFSTNLWAQVGGDFSSMADATASVSGNGFYEWSSPEMVATVQSWLNDPAANHGWIGIAAGGAKRFDSRENADDSVRPVLVVGFQPPPTPRAIGIPILNPWGALALVVLLLFAAWSVSRRDRPFRGY